MKFLSSWSRTKIFKDRRQGEKGKSPTVPVGKRATNLSSRLGTPNKSVLLRKPSPKQHIVATEKEKMPSANGSVMVSTTTNTGFLPNAEEDRPCFLFEDNEEDNEEDNINDTRVKGKPPVEFEPSHQRNLKLLTINDATMNADLGTPLISSPKNLFHPPHEIMVDHLAVPPSPMKEPNIDISTSPSMNRRLLDNYQPDLYLNFQQSSPRESLHHRHCIGDPVGDIGMQRQLNDAQRLVRIILGKPMNRDEEILGASSILQAIRSYALMKAELINLRKKQECMDGDPPAILQTLGSPAATTPSTTRTGICSGRRSVGQSATDVFQSPGSARNNSNLDAPVSSALERANRTIERLQEELTSAKDTILELNKQMNGDEWEGDCRSSTKSIHEIEETVKLAQLDQERDGLESEQAQALNEKENYENEETEISTQIDQREDELESKQDGNSREEEKIENDETEKVTKIQHHQDEHEPKQDENPKGAKIEDDKDCWKNAQVIVGNEDAQQLIRRNRSVVEESKQDGNLDVLLDEIVLIPQHARTKDVVREKIELYYHTISRDACESQILEVENKMRQSQIEFGRRILEMENKMKIQDQDHKKQIQAMQMGEDDIVDSKTKQKKNTILIEVSQNASASGQIPPTVSTRKPMMDSAVKKSCKKINSLEMLEAKSGT